jgi:hypothetical protein
MIMLKKIIGTTFTLLICEVILLGNGKWSEFYLDLNIRKLGFIFLIILLLAYIYKTKFRKLYFILLIVPPMFFIIWSIIIPFFYNTRLFYSLNEGLVVLGFTAMPILVIFFRANIIYWEKIKKVILAALILNAINHILLYLSVLNFIPNNVTEIYENILNPYGDTSLNINNTIEEVRVGWIGSVFLPMLIGGFFLFPIKTSFKILVISLGFFALYLNGQRGFYFSIAYAALCTLLYSFVINHNLNNLKKYFLPISVFIVVALIYYLSNPEFLELIKMSREGSDEIRFDQAHALLDEFQSSPLFGKGMGYTVSSLIRSEHSPYSYEQYALSLLMKCGLFGVFLFFYYCGLWVKALDGSPIYVEEPLINKKYLSLFFLVIVIFAASTSNPYIFNFVGMYYLYIIIIEYGTLTKSV